ncbi:Ribonuclease Rh [Smittium mucronatum]|uniref:ribonuclease T2 n=1 Tax=Smittium mucronatum TaxID=133383 RepID=A0A1R0H6S4_9FUNG|nr:Ribonuclease Rh [Smittium mucronatum]
MRVLAIVSFVAAVLFPTASQQFKQTCPITAPACSLKGSLDNCCVNRDGWIVLSQQWATNLQPVDKFTIHGLWPDHCDGTFEKVSCDTSRNYLNVDQIVKSKDPVLFDTMTKVWPSTSTNAAFWEHEWYKHGTCYNVANPPCILDYTQYDDMIMYFKQVVRLADKYDIYKALKAEGIVPGSTYTKSQMVNALFKQLGIYVVPQCSSKGVLTEFWSYFDLLGQDTFVPRVPDVNPNTCQSIVYPVKTVSA